MARKKIDLEYNQIKLNILKSNEPEEHEKVKESIRQFGTDYELEDMTQQLWDFFDLMLNKKTKVKE